MPGVQGGAHQQKAGVVEGGGAGVGHQGDIALIERGEHLVELGLFVEFVITRQGSVDVEVGEQLAGVAGVLRGYQLDFAQDAQGAGAVTINYGVFVNNLISFLIVAFAVFLLIKTINKMRREQEAPSPEPTTKECAYCCSTIPVKATRCPHCTSELNS